MWMAWPLTIVSICDTSLDRPGPLDTMTGLFNGRSSTPHLAQSDKWCASDMSIEERKLHRLSMLLTQC